MDSSVNESFVEPPDPAVAVGPDDIVQTVNLQMRVYNRLGNTELTVPLAVFFGDVAGVGGLSDPQVAFHAASGHWLLSILSWDCLSGYLHLAVSTTSDPKGSWWIFTKVYASALPDYPGLGYSDDKVVVGVNQYQIDSNTCEPTTWIGASVAAWDTADLLDGGTYATAWTPPEVDILNWRPAFSLSAVADVHSIAEQSNGYFHYRYLTGSVVDLATGGPDPLDWGGADLSDRFAPSQPVLYPIQPGGPLLVDNRITSAVWRDNRLVFASTYPCGPSGLHDCPRITEVGTLYLTPNQDFLIGDGSDGNDNYMAGVTIDGAGTLYSVWSRSSAGSPVSIWSTHQLITDARDTVNDWLLVRGGEASYSGYRWGDYALLSTDPIDPNTVWQAHEFARLGGGWGTFVSRLAVASTPDAPTGVSATAGDSQATVLWSAPASDGDSPIYVYTVASSPGNLICTAAGLSCTVLGLANGTPYTFTVTATNAVGTGPASAPSNSVTPGASGPTISVSDASVLEGSRKHRTRTLVFTVTLSQPLNRKVTVRYATTNGTATARSDYIGKNATLTISKSTTSATIVILVKGDKRFEPDEILYVDLWNAVGAAILDVEGLGTIINDD